MSASSTTPDIPPPPPPPVRMVHLARSGSAACETLSSQIAKAASFQDDDNDNGTFDRVAIVGSDSEPRVMRIVHVSDTHGRHSDVHVPDGDVLVHSGDFSQRAKTDDDARAALQSICGWFASLMHERVILIGGNHEIALSKWTVDEIRAMLPDKVTYLMDESVVIGGVRFYGSPWTRSRRMGFSADDDEIRRHWARIPRDTDVLVTHQPPFGVLDLARHRGKSSRRCIDCDQVHRNRRHWGCRHLLKRVAKLDCLKLHCFGHVHECAGVVKIESTLFSNGAADLTLRCVAIDYHREARQQRDQSVEKCSMQ
jgi:Icc-related predicted phosphoesterase